MKNFNDRILKALAIIISINLVVYGVASTATTKTTTRMTTPGTTKISATMKMRTTKKTSLCFSRMLRGLVLFCPSCLLQ